MKKSISESIKVKKSRFGDGLFATIPVNTGEVVFEEDTKLFSVEPDVCEYCFDLINPGSLSVKCVICNRMFCGEKCRKKGKSAHNISCSRLPLTTYQQLIYRLHCIGNKGFCYQKSIMPGCKFIGKNNKISEDEWNNCSRMVTANAFRLKTCLLSESIGYAMYNYASKINHSCLPNCVYFFDKSRIIVRAIEPINAGDEITISYIPAHYVFADSICRYNFIMKYCAFECGCRLCSSESADGNPDLFCSIEYISDINNRKSDDLAKKSHDIIQLIRNNYAGKPLAINSMFIEAITAILVSRGDNEVDDRDEHFAEFADDVFRQHFGINYLSYFTKKEKLLLNN